MKNQKCETKPDLLRLSVVTDADNRALGRLDNL